jgi:hypothetical protein
MSLGEGGIGLVLPAQIFIQRQRFEPSSGKIELVGLGTLGVEVGLVRNLGRGLLRWDWCNGGDRRSLLRSA